MDVAVHGVEKEGTIAALLRIDSAVQQCSEVRCERVYQKHTE